MLTDSSVWMDKSSVAAVVRLKASVAVVFSATVKVEPLKDRKPICASPERQRV